MLRTHHRQQYQFNFPIIEKKFNIFLSFRIFFFCISFGGRCFQIKITGMKNTSTTSRIEILLMAKKLKIDKKKRTEKCKKNNMTSKYSPIKKYECFFLGLFYMLHFTRISYRKMNRNNKIKINILRFFQLITS